MPITVPAFSIRVVVSVPVISATPIATASWHQLEIPRGG
jgi:hypothetical protein